MHRMVTVTRLADRHEDSHVRDFAETQIVTVPDGHIRAVVDAALAQLTIVGGGRFSILVDEPHE